MASDKNFFGLAVSRIGKKVFLFCKEKFGDNQPVQILIGDDGLHFERLPQKIFFKKFLGIKNKLKIDDDFKISKLNEQYVLFYKQKVNENEKQLMVAVSADGIIWEKIGPVEGIKDYGAVIIFDHLAEKYLMFFGKNSVQIATSSDLKKWHVKRGSLLRPRDGYFDGYRLSADNAFWTKEGIILVYSAQNKIKQWGVGAVLLDKNDYQRILWRSSVSLWQQPKEWNGRAVRFIGSVFKNNEILSYWDYADELHVMPISLARFPVHKKDVHREIANISKLKLKKAKNNPVLIPRSENKWESRETFNPAAVNLNGKVHLLYRALGESGISVLGYASSSDGINIDERLDTPVYLPSQIFEYAGKNSTKNFAYSYMSGGSWSGCEDPRISVIGDMIYMTYVAFNGYNPPGVALTSISIEDFLSKNWNWKIPKLISRPGEIQKNWVLFPEKINGKFAILHSISPKISIDYFNSLDSEKIVIESYHNNKSDETRWDNILRGVGSPPIKTEHGWLVLYHAMDKRDPNKYKVGAMLLDYKNPEEVLYRSFEPILEPIEKYENEGSKAGVVYVCGSVVKDEKLFVYYGGADRFTCVATTPIKDFLAALINSSAVTSFRKIAIA